MDVELPERPVTVADLASQGLTPWQVRRLVTAGHLRRLLRGVYVAAAVPDSHELRVRAMQLAVAEGHVLVDRSAAYVHGVDVYTLDESGEAPLETCVLRGRRPTDCRDLAGGSRDLAPGDLARLDGLVVTTPVRTALDLGCCLRRRDAFAAMCSLARSHGFGAADLGRELPRFRRRRGVVQLRELVPLVDPRIESPREAWVLLEIHDAGIELPEPQFWIEIDGVPTYRLDFAYPRRRIAVEYDGYDAHERTDQQRAHDLRRRSWLREQGWTVIVVRSGDFTGDARNRWIRQLREALSDRYTNRRW